MYALMIVPSDFPEGDAGAVRDLAFAKIYQELGYDVYLIGMNRTQSIGNYCEVDYISIYQNAFGFISHIKRYMVYTQLYIDMCKKCIKAKGYPAVIHINTIPFRTIKFLKKISIKYNIPIIHDSTEWYSPCEFKYGVFDKSYIIKNCLNTKVIKSPIKIVAISKFLEQHFKNRGCKTIRIPVIMNIKDTKVNRNNNYNELEKLKLIYAGSPANKDSLKEIIIGISSLDENEKSKLEVHIFGVSRQQIEEHYGIKYLHACFQVHGRVPREDVLQTMEYMDFSLLLRPPNERYTKAGFPTKSVEAMSYGVAMMCNLSSDLSFYLIDGNNSIIVQDATPIALASAVQKALNMQRSDIEQIKHAARRLAEVNFDYRRYVDTVRGLIQA